MAMNMATARSSAVSLRAIGAHTLGRKCLMLCAPLLNYGVEEGVDQCWECFNHSHREGYLLAFGLLSRTSSFNLDQPVTAKSMIP